MVPHLSQHTLSGNQLNGTLPNSWGAFHNMLQLNLAANRLTGTLPSSWSGMSSLSSLLLQSNSVVGSLPASWGPAFSNLTWLYLNANNLTGTLPSEWSHMTSVIYIRLDQNQLSGNPIPSEWMASMNNLTNFTAGTNLFHGTLPEIPEDAPAGWQSIVEVLIPFNSISGTLPSSWGKVSSLQRLSLTSNNLTGILPSNWSTLTSLVYLYVQLNALTGSLPSSWGPTMLHLTVFYAFTNSLNGTIPSSWAGMVSLVDIEIAENQLTGSLPSSWSQLLSLEVVAVFSNHLSGTLPSSWGQMRRIRTFLASSNSFTGTLPDTWGNWSLLITIRLYDNMLTGPPIPAAWVESMTSLQVLSLYINLLNGALPEVPAGKWANVTTISLYNNNITGTLPSTWSNLARLGVLSLGSNSISGTLPDAWAQLSRLTTLELQTNSISGTLPLAWGGGGASLEMLSVLDASDNQLSGTIPEGWGNFSALTTLSLFGNRLSGSLPNTLGSPSLPITNHATLLWLHNNLLTGTLPPLRSEMVQLVDLRLSFNLLQGSIPSLWASMFSLQYLYLNHNQLNGTLPASTGGTFGLRSISTLSVANNQMTGTLPGSWSSLSSLQTLDASRNLLTGSLPVSWSGRLNLLSTLALGNNLLNGTLPQGFRFPALKTLALRNNRLTGPIPSTWLVTSIAGGVMGRLATLDLSMNRLRGSLPSLVTPGMTIAPWSPFLQSVNVSQNCLQGFVPASWGTTATPTPLAIVILTLCGTNVHPSFVPTSPQVNGSSFALLLAGCSDANAAYWPRYCQAVSGSTTLRDQTRSFTSADSSSTTVSSGGLSASGGHHDSRSHSLFATSTPTAERSASDASASASSSASVSPSAVSASSVSSSVSPENTLSGVSRSAPTPTPTTIDVVDQIPSSVGAVSTATNVLAQGSSVSAAVSSLLAMPASALSSRRLSILASLGNCADDSRPSVDDAMSGDATAAYLDSPMQLQVRIASNDPGRGSVQRGTIVGDIAVAAMCVAVGGVLTVAVHFWTVSDSEKRNERRRTRQRHQRRSRQNHHREEAGIAGDDTDELLGWLEQAIEAAARLRLPGLFFVLIALFLQPVVTASVQLLAYGGPAADYVIGACGAIVSVLLVAAVGRVVDPRKVAFRAIAEETNEDTLHNRRNRRLSRSRSRSWYWQLVAAVEARWMALHEESNEWRARDEVRDRLFVERYGFLFESCREARHWWVLVEMSATIVLAVVGGVVPPTSTSCVGMAWFALCLCVVLLAACVVARPMSSVLESGVVVLLWGSQVAMAACAVSGNADEAAAVIGIVSSTLSGVLAVLMMMTAVRNAQWDKELVALKLSAASEFTVKHSAPFALLWPRDQQHRTTGAELEMLIRLICHKSESDFATVHTKGTLRHEENLSTQVSNKL